MLSDHAISKGLDAEDFEVYPLQFGAIQPTSVDVRLGPTILKYRPEKWYHRISWMQWHPWFRDHIDLRDTPDLRGRYEEFDTDGYTLEPGEFVLSSTLETLRLGNRHGAIFDGRSTGGRLGLLVHITAGFCDPGFHGNVTLEIKNIAPYAITLYQGFGIGQLIFESVEGEVRNPYGSVSCGSKYGGVQSGPRPPILRKGRT
jgi:dCTP deaminase